MVEVGGVRVGVDERFVPVPVAVRLSCRIVEAVRVLVVFVGDVQVVVFEQLVRVRVSVPIAQVQPHANQHQHQSRPEQQQRRLAQ